THPEAGPLAPARSQRSERRVPPRRRSPEPAQNGQDDPATEPRTGLMEEADMLVRYSQSRADRPRTHFFNRISPIAGTRQYLSPATFGTYFFKIGHSTYLSTSRAALITPLVPRLRSAIRGRHALSFNPPEGSYWLDRCRDGAVLRTVPHPTGRARDGLLRRGALSPGSPSAARPVAPRQP